MAIVIPYFLMAMAARLLDTRVILIICYLLFNIPFTILMMRGFFEDIPMEIEEAGKIDGCNGLQVFKELILPLSLPGLTATAIFCLINSWNEFVFANFLTSVNAKTVPTSVMLFLSVSGTKWGEIYDTRFNIWCSERLTNVFFKIRRKSYEKKVVFYGNGIDAGIVNDSLFCRQGDTGFVCACGYPGIRD